MLCAHGPKLSVTVLARLLESVSCCTIAVLLSSVHVCSDNDL
jgi:hypothetical protein